MPAILASSSRLSLATPPAAPSATGVGHSRSVVVAAVLGMALVKLLDYLRKRDADKEAAQIIERAEIEASRSPQGGRRRSPRNGPPGKGPAGSRERGGPPRSCTSANASSTRRRTPSSRAPTSSPSRRRWSRATSGAWPRRSRTPTAGRRSSTTCSTSNGRRCTSSAA